MKQETRTREYVLQAEKLPLGLAARLVINRIQKIRDINCLVVSNKEGVYSVIVRNKIPRRSPPINPNRQDFYLLVEKVVRDEAEKRPAAQSLEITIEYQGDPLAENYCL